MLARLSAVLVILALAFLGISAVPWPGSLSGAVETATLQETSAMPATPASDNDLVSRGQALFAAKGCISCHHHAEVEQSGQIPIGPDLSHYKPDPEFVRRWLRDPSAIRPGTMMPDLGLSEAEIDALMAFLNDE